MSGCNDCEGRGWCHMEDSCGRGPGIERCDTCGAFDSDDEAARAHALDCRCSMGLADAPQPAAASAWETWRAGVDAARAIVDLAAVSAERGGRNDEAARLREIARTLWQLAGGCV